MFISLMWSNNLCILEIELNLVLTCGSLSGPPIPHILWQNTVTLNLAFFMFLSGHFWDIGIIYMKNI